MDRLALRNKPSFRFYVIYALTEPPYGFIRYVGATTTNPKKRFLSHLCHHTDDYRGRWINSLKRKKLVPGLQILESGYGDLWAAEKFWIRYLKEKGVKLVNATDGGEGALNPCPETRERMRRAAATRPHHPNTESQKEFTRQRSIGNKWNMGRKNNPETIARMKESARNSWTPQRKQKAREILAKRVFTSKWKEAIRRSKIGKTASSATKAKMSLAHLGNKSNTGRKLTEEHKANIGNKLKGRKRPPFTKEWREALSRAKRKQPCNAQ